MRNRLDTSFYVWDYRMLVSVKRSECPLAKLGHCILSLVNSCRSVCCIPISGHIYFWFHFALVYIKLFVDTGYDCTLRNRLFT